MIDFGLPTVSSDPKRERLHAAQVRYEAPLILMRLFKQIEPHLGAHETRRLFEQSAALLSKKKTGRGPVDSVRDSELLTLHDAGSTAKQIYEIPNGKRFGNSEDAIQKKITRLLKAREERQKQDHNLAEAYQKLLNDMARLDARAVSADK